MRIILASASPRRREILSTFGVQFEILPANADEHSSITDPVALVKELALRKAHAVREILCARGEWNEDTLIIASDTVVENEGEILGKPNDDADAARMLRGLSGKTHRVVSGVALLCEDRETAGADSTAVHFAPMNEKDIEWYVKSGEPRDKAGAYAVQGLAALFIKGIEGDYFNVVGLPVYCMDHLLFDFLGKHLTELGSSTQ